MKRMITTMMVLAVLTTGAFAQWNETFDTDATSDGYGQLTSDYTWQWFTWGTVYFAGGDMVMQGDYSNIYDPLQLETCWMQTDPLTDPDVVLTPSDFELYVRVKFLDSSPSEDDQLHINMCADPDYLSNFAANTVALSPAGGIVGTYSFQTDAFNPAVNAAVVYNEYFWVKATFVGGTTISAWAFPDGGSPAETPDVVTTQTTVDPGNLLPAQLFIAKSNDENSWVHISDFYYNSAPLSINNEVSIADNYTLHQNYPNPFNPVTNIQFSIPEQGLVTLKVFNVVGEEVATLVNNTLPIGTYTKSWNASDMPSGVYLYQLESKNFTQTKRLVLIK